MAPFREKTGFYALVLGEDTYTSQTAQQEGSARRLKSLIPSLAGDLAREKPNAKFPNSTASAMNAGVGWLDSFDFQNSDGSFTRFLFAATATKLYQTPGYSSLVTATANPTSDEAETGQWSGATAGTRYTLVDDHPDASGSDYLTHGTVSGYLTFGFTALSVPAGATITKVELLYYDRKANFFSAKLAGRLKVGGAYYDATSHKPSEDVLILRTDTWMKNPKTGVAWTVNDVNGVGGNALSAFGVISTSTISTLDLASIQLKVTYVLSSTSVDWTEVSAVGTLAGYPQGVAINNRFHLSDGATSWIFDGGFWVPDGFPIPLVAPSIKDKTQAGVITATVGRYYWTTFADEDAPSHESSSSPISASTGALTSKKVIVRQLPGTITSLTSSPSVTGSGTSFHSQHVGMAIYSNGTLLGTIASVSSATSLELTANSAAARTTADYFIAPARATHIHFYASEYDGSQLGFYLGSVPITAGSSTFEDNSPFYNEANYLFLPIERPIRNDPTEASTILGIFKGRIFRRNESLLNNFTYTAQEEVAALSNGAAEESVPGVDDNTISDLDNESPVSDEAREIRGMRKHGDALYIGSEKDIVPLYGDTREDFALSEITSFRTGLAGRYAINSNPYGLAFVSYDKQVELYPSQGVPAGVDASLSLIELSRPKRKAFELIKSSDLDGVWLVYYGFGRRKWLVLAYQDKNNVYHTWVFDFEAKSWFELARGVMSLHVHEYENGSKILLGGGTDGFVYVLDDVTGTYVSSASYPQGIFRPALMDFMDASHKHIFEYLEYEISNADIPVEVNYWFDPDDADAPGAGTSLVMEKVRGSNKYRGFPKGGGLCDRLLVEVLVGDGLSTDTNDGALRGLVVASRPATALIR